MFTLFQLKQNGAFRCCYQTPYYIKNLFLMGALAVLLFVVYVVYFRADGSLKNVLRIVNGMDSSTFNYLEANRNELYVDYKAHELPREGFERIDSRDFFTHCVRVNKPCMLRNMSYEWPAYQTWNSSWYFNHTLLGSDQRVQVYQVPDERMGFKLKHEMYSFPEQFKTEMSYGEFLQRVQDERRVGQTVLRDSRKDTGLFEKIQPHITAPEFFEEISDLLEVELLQGAFLVDKPHYEKTEQIMCAVSGTLQLRMVAHVYRQECYIGEDLIGTIYDESKGEGGLLELSEQKHVSPVNFFLPKLAKYPNIDKDMIEEYVVPEGDCIFVPAYYFYQYSLMNNVDYKYYPNANIVLQPPKNAKDIEKKIKPIATAINFKFEGNSRILYEFMEAVEQGIVQ